MRQWRTRGIGHGGRENGDGKRRDGPAAQAALPSSSIGSGKLCVARALASSSAAMSRQEPQVEPQPVRMVNSATVLQPLSAASRIWWSVTPLQMQTYTAGIEGRQARSGLPAFHRKREWLSIIFLNHSR